MGKYTPTTVADGNVIDPDVFNDNVNAIKTAYDTIDDTNLANGSISVVKLAEPYGYFEVDLVIDAVPINQADVRFDQVALPDSGEFIKVKVVAEGMAATAQVDIKDSVDGTLLDALITVAAADTVYGGTIKSATKARSENDMIRLHCTTNGTGTLTKLRITLLFKKLLSS